MQQKIYTKYLNSPLKCDIIYITTKEMMPVKDLDTLSKGYMSQNDIFADAFNYLIYDGQQVIKPEQLSPLDTTELAAPYGAGGEAEPVQKLRDVLKYVTAMTDDSTAYLVLGIENQQNVHLAMPVRNMLYDALEYSRQVSEAASRHRQNKEHGSREEFLSGFHRGDRLIPVITLVVYFSSDKWDGPRRLFDMMEIKDDKIRALTNDYKIHLLAPAEMSDDEFDKLRSELGRIMKYIQCSTDKNRLSQLVEADERYTHISKAGALLLNECTKSEIHIDDSKEDVDMCQAIKDIKADSMAEGVAKGRAEGRAEGVAEGVIKTIKAIMKSMNWTAEQAVAAAGVPENERKAYISKLQS